MEQLGLVFLHWKDYWGNCATWSVGFLWDHLADSRAISILGIVWLGLILKSWHALGWRAAGLQLMVRAGLAIEALKWPAIVLAIIFLFIFLFIAPAQKENTLQAANKLLQESNESLQAQLIDKEKNIKTLQGGIGEAEENKRNLIAEIEHLKKRCV